MNKKEQYEEKYRTEGLNPSPYFLKQFQYINNYYIKGNDLKILDLGGGTGEYSLLLQKIYSSVTLFDFSEEAIKKAKRNGVISTICDDFFSYDFNNLKYDVVLVKGFSLLNTDNENLFTELTNRMKTILNDDGCIVYMGQTDLSESWTKSGWYQLSKEEITNYFDEYLILPAFRYQLKFPHFFNKIITNMLSFFKKLPKSFTLVGVIK